MVPYQVPYPNECIIQRDEISTIDFITNHSQMEFEVNTVGFGALKSES